MPTLRPSAARLDLPRYEAPPVLGGGRRMTLLGALPRVGLAGFAADAEERRFALDDGSALVGRCHWQAGRRRDVPVAVLLHGLAGSAESGYVVGTAAKLFAAGFHVVRLNARNCGGTEHLARSIYHAAQIDDPLAVLRELSLTDGFERLYQVGFSMGGSLSLLAAAHPDRLPDALCGLVAISPPLDLDACSLRLQSTAFNRGLGRRFLQSFSAMLQTRERLFPGQIDLAALDAVRTLREFDRAFTAPLAGYASLADYYAAGSVRGRLHALDRPTLIIHALDDPVVDPAAFRERCWSALPLVRAEVSPTGGHVGFVGAARSRGPRGVDPDRRWAENRVVDFLHALEQRR